MRKASASFFSNIMCALYSCNSVAPQMPYYLMYPLCYHCECDHHMIITSCKPPLDRIPSFHGHQLQPHHDRLQPTVLKQMISKVEENIATTQAEYLWRMRRSEQTIEGFDATRRRRFQFSARSRPLVAIFEQHCASASNSCRRPPPLAAAAPAERL